LGEELAAVDTALGDTGARGAVVPATPKRRRSTRRRDDVPDLPRRAPVPTTLGRTYTDPRSGRTFRPSLFVTLTLPSYGRVDEDGCPVNPAGYDYRAAARDALHFGKLLDRWAQNLRRVAGYDVQYFAAVEPQRRGAPHAHYAIRGTLARAVVKELTAATYVNVWWPSTDHVVYDGPRLLVWDPDSGAFRDPHTAAALPTWEEAIDALDAEDDADDRPRAKARQARRADHIARLVEALRWEPCSPRCANWLRYGIQPRNPRPTMRPGCCRSKAHRPTHLGYGGRRVLVSRKWTAKDLRDHRHERRDHVLATLAAGIHPDQDAADVSATGRPLLWELAKPTDPDVKPRHHRLLVAIGCGSSGVTGRVTSADVQGRRPRPSCWPRPWPYRAARARSPRRRGVDLLSCPGSPLIISTHRGSGGATVVSRAWPARA